MENLKLQSPKSFVLNTKITIEGSRFFFTISNYFSIQNIPVASGCSEKFSECTICRETFFKRIKNGKNNLSQIYPKMAITKYCNFDRTRFKQKRFPI